MEKLKALWRGDLSLGEAFWTWGVTTSILFLMLITKDLPVPALVVGYGVSLPYNFVATVGVWRSAARHDGPAHHADLARGASAILMTVLSVT